MTGWQDSFVPDNGTIQPPAVQAQGWQSSFVPDGQQPPVNQSSFVQNPSWENAGNAALGATKDMAMYIPDMASNIASMTYAKLPTGGIFGPANADGNSIYGAPKPVITGDVGQSANNVMNLAMPFMSGGGGETSAFPTSGDDGGGGAPPPVAPTSGDIKLIKQKLDLAGITPQQYADALLNSSPDDFAGELGGDPLRMQTQAQAKITGPSMQAARDAMRQRLDAAPQRVQQIIEQTFYPSSAAGPTVGGDASLMKGAAAPIEPVEQAQQNLVDIKAKLPALYNAADQTSVPRRASLGVINTPAGQQALKDTVTKLANQGIQPEDAGIVIDPSNGFHGLAPQVPVPTLSELSKSLGDQVARNPLTGAIEDSQSNVIEGLRKHITSYLSDNSPEFNTANTNAAAQLQGQSAFEAGRQLAHAAAGEKADALAQRANNSFSPQELSYQKAGYVQGLGDALQGAPLGGGNPASRIAKGTVQNTTADILQSPTAGQKFADALMQEKNRVDLAQRGLYGSNTAESLNAGLPEVPTSAEGMVSKLAGHAMDFVNAGKNQRIAQLLYATTPEQKALLAAKIVQ